ncbi:hypothetical protein ABW19_dt0207607 [Dactylella cylindrospora]|nr:hypothetical protein ABW19_dt0207607 [Dactylella cylindrospora]
MSIPTTDTVSPCPNTNFLIDRPTIGKDLGPDLEIGVAEIKPRRTLSGLSASWVRKPFRRLYTWSSKPPRNAGHLEAPSLTYQIEDYPAGYPRLSALMAADESFQIFRRFSSLRMRLMLLKQDQISELEEKLREIDENDSPIFLGCRREDRNEERLNLISRIETTLTSFDKLAKRSLEISQLNAADPRDVQSLRNWHAGDSCIERKEFEFLQHSRDLWCFSAPSDGVLAWVERYICDRLLSFARLGRSDISRDERVHIFSRKYANLLARALITPLIVILLLAPVIICNFINHSTIRLTIISLSTTLFLTILSLLTRGKMIELIVAGATYTTVLVVFISDPTVLQLQGL